MALLDCPECGHGFSQYANTCPQCGFPNPLAEHPAGRGRALSRREQRAVGPFSGWEPAAGGRQPLAARPECRPPQPEYFPPEPPPQRQGPDVVTVYAQKIDPPEEKRQYDNSLRGFFHGKTHFWFALCVYFLGVTLALTVVAVAIGEPEFMKVAVGGWAFVGLFLLFWNAKNLAHDSGKWIARLLIVIILLAWIGVGTH